MSREEAIKAAIKTCISRGIFVDFLTKHGSEVENMLLTDWNLKDALEVEREEAEEKTSKELFALWESGMSLAEAKRKFSLKNNRKQK